MFLTLLALATTPTFAAFEPCRLAEINPSLPLYVGISQTLATKGVVGASVLYATAPDPMFGDDEPIEFRFVPSITPTLTLVVTHHDAVSIGEEPVTIAEISDSIVIDLTGNVSGGHSCPIRLAMATTAMEKMHEAYGF